MQARLRTNIPPNVVALWKAHGFLWGGDYAGNKDAMHFEFLGSVADARALTAKILAGKL